MIPSAGLNATPKPNLSFLNLFSGPFQQHRKGGLTSTMRAFGWDSFTEVDNHPKLGGGWQSDLLNDSFYASILQRATAGAFDAIMAAFPCNTTTVARCFDASHDGGDSGPPLGLHNYAMLNFLTGFLPSVSQSSTDEN